MKHLKTIIESIKVNSKTKVHNNDFLSFNEFKEEITKIFDDKFCNKFCEIGCDLYNIQQKQFKQLTNGSEYKELFNYGAELVNHPMSYYNKLKAKSFKKVYQDNIIDVCTYYWKSTIVGECIFFIDHQHDKFYIYLIK